MVLRAGSRSVLLLLLFRCGCGELVLDPEAFHEEVDDGSVQVLVEGGTVKVMAFVRVDLRGRRGDVTHRRWPPGAWGCSCDTNPAQPRHHAHTHGSISVWEMNFLNHSSASVSISFSGMLCRAR